MSSVRLETIAVHPGHSAYPFRMPGDHYIQGSFTRLSELLGSPLWAKTEPLMLSTLWDSLPENRFAPLGDVGTSRRTPLYVDH